MPYITQFERQPYSITSYSVNSGLTEWIKTEIKLYKALVKDILFTQMTHAAH